MDAANELSSKQVLAHGGTGGSLYSLTLTSAEYWTKATLCQGQKDGRTRIFYVLATTSSGRTVSTGKTTSECITYEAPSGFQIVGFSGGSGTEVDQLGFIYGLR